MRFSEDLQKPVFVTTQALKPLSLQHYTPYHTDIAVKAGYEWKAKIIYDFIDDVFISVLEYGCINIWINAYKKNQFILLIGL